MQSVRELVPDLEKCDKNPDHPGAFYLPQYKTLIEIATGQPVTVITADLFGKNPECVYTPELAEWHHISKFELPSSTNTA